MVYNVAGYEFTSAEQARLAKRDLEIIIGLENKADLGNPVVAKKLLVDCKAKGVFKTELGLDFLDSLQNTVLGRVGSLRSVDDNYQVNASSAAQNKERKSSLSKVFIYCSIALIVGGITTFLLLNGSNDPGLPVDRPMRTPRPTASDPTSSPNESIPSKGISIDKAQETPGIYIMEGDTFYYLESPKPIRDFFFGDTSYPGDIFLIEADDDIPKISNLLQLVLVGLTSVRVFEFDETGYTIPYEVSFGYSFEQDSPITIHYGRYQTDASSYDKINGNDPIQYIDRIIHTRSYFAMMQTYGILSANRNEEFNLGWFSGTTWKETTYIADKRFFLAYPKSNSSEKIHEIEETINGYFLVNFTKPLIGYHCIDGRIVEFIDDNDYSTPIPPTSSETALNPHDTHFSLNETLFTWLGKSPKELEQLAGAYKGSDWWEGYIHAFGDYWFGFDEEPNDDDTPSGRSKSVLFLRLSDVIYGLTDAINVLDLDKLFDQQSTLEYSIMDDDVYRIYSYQGTYVIIYSPRDFLEPDTIVEIWSIPGNVMPLPDVGLSINNTLFI